MIGEFVREAVDAFVISERDKEIYLNGNGSWKAIEEISFNYKGEKTHCDYCLSDSYDDERGNCICCGAPRIKQKLPIWDLGNGWCSTACDDDLSGSTW
jgi:ribosomal protein L37E